MKNVLISGVSRGLGLVLTESLLRDGYVVYGISRSSNSDIDDVKKKYGKNFTHLICDLGEESSISKISKFLMANKIKLDSFVNSAAIAYDDIITNANFQKLDEMYRTNVLVPIMLTKYVIRNFILHKTTGSVIHVSSVSAHTGYKGLSMYASTKGALEAFSKNIAREWGELGIRSNCVVSGFMETGMSSTLSVEQKQRIYNRTSLKKETSKESVSETIKFLIGEGSSSITGQKIFVDSGTI